MLVCITALTVNFSSLCSYTPNTFIAFISGFNSPSYIAITPDNNYAYVTDDGSDSVLVIDTNPSSPTFNTLISAPNLLGVFNGPSGIAITPNGQYAYVANSASNNVLAIDTNPLSTTFNSVIATLTGPFDSPNSIAMTPNGNYAYVTNAGNNSITVINLANNTILTTPNLNGILNSPFAIAITPNGNYAYITNLSGSVTVVDIRINAPVSAPGLASVNSQPEGLAITANGLVAYVSDGSGTDVTVLDINPASLTFNTVISTPNLANTFDFPNGVATTSDGNYAYVSNFIGATGNISSVSVIDTNPASPTYNSTLNTPGLVVASPPPFTRFISLAATPNARFVYVVDGFNNTVDVIYTGIITPPLNFTSCTTQNTFLLQRDLINYLTWSAPTIGNPPVTYNIYRDPALQTLVATIPATSTLEYYDHNRSPYARDTYYIVSVDGSGNMSSPVSTAPTSLCI